MCGYAADVSSSSTSLGPAGHGVPDRGDKMWWVPPASAPPADQQLEVGEIVDWESVGVEQLKQLFGMSFVMDVDPASQIVL